MDPDLHKPESNQTELNPDAVALYQPLRRTMGAISRHLSDTGIVITPKGVMIFVRR